jgi:hypothetical protein
MKTNHMIDSENALIDRSFLSTKEGTQTKVIKYIHQDQRHLILGTLKNVDGYFFLKRKTEEIRNNAKDFKDYFSAVKEKIDSYKNDEFEDLNTLFIDFNRLFINYCTSVRSLTEIVEKKIKLAYSKESMEFEKFETIRHCFYDSYFSYKFLYNIRNFALHFQYPIHFVNVVFDNYVGNNAQKRDLWVMFVKQHLLQDPDFSKKMGNDLAKYGDYFPVQPIIEDSLKWLKDYFLQFINIEKETYLKTIEIIESLGSIYEFSNLGISIIEKTSITGHKLYTSIIPISLLLEIKTNLK